MISSNNSAPAPLGPTAYATWEAAHELVAARGGKIEELESIRGLAALLIVLFHVPKWNGLLDVPFVMNGSLMVDLFFVLSGFVIFTAYGTRITSWREMARFQFLRFGRLYPIHLAFLALWVALEVVRWLAARNGASGFSSQPFTAPNTGAAVLEHLVLLQGMIPGQSHLSFNWPSWSISTEFYTYVVFALAVLFLRGRAVFFFAAAAAGAALLLLTGERPGVDSFLRTLAGFSVGCMTALLVQRTRAALPPLLSLLVFCAIVVFVTFAPQDASRFLITYALTAALIVTICLSTSDGLLTRLLRHPVLLWLGAISYSVYMAHSIVLASVGMVLKRVLKRPEVLEHGHAVLALSMAESVLAIALMLALVLVAAHLAYTFIEKPFRAKSRRLVRAK